MNTPQQNQRQPNAAGGSHPPDKALKFWESYTPEADAVFWCSRCGTENQLTHGDGDYPFGQLKCRQCSHIFCERCQLAGDLHVSHELQSGDAPVVNRKVVPYCQVCPTCGTTHRARRLETVVVKPWPWSEESERTMLDFDVKCGCGETSSPKWIRFSIDCGHWLFGPDHKRDIAKAVRELQVDKFDRSVADAARRRSHHG